MGYKVILSLVLGRDNALARLLLLSDWIFGLEPSSIPAFLKPFHLALIADVGNADYQEKYLKPLRRSLIVFEGERIVRANVTI